jgi:hypothetical protein
MATGPETKRLCSNRVETHTYREIHTEWGENWQNEKRAAVTFGSILVFSKGLFTRRQTRNLPFSPSGCLSRSLLLFQYAPTTAVPSLLLNAIITATPTRPLAGPWRRPVMRNRQITTRLRVFIIIKRKAQCFPLSWTHSYSLLTRSLYFYW